MHSIKTRNYNSGAFKDMQRFYINYVIYDGSKSATSHTYTVLLL